MNYWSPKIIIVTSIVVLFELFSSLNPFFEDSLIHAKEILIKKLMIMNVDGSDAKVLFESDEFTALGSPSYSNDGKKIAMDGWRIHKGENNTASRILVINSDGSELEDLGDGAMPTWSADRKQLAFSRYFDRDAGRNSGVWMMSHDGKNKTLIRERGWSAQWSPDGKKIAYTYSNKINLYDVKSKKSEVIEFPNDMDVGYIRWNISWSADSSTICFKSSGPKRNQTRLASIHIPSRDTLIHYATEKQATPSEDTAWHPNGETVYFMMWTNKTRSQKIFFFDPLEANSVPELLPGQDFEGTAVDGICCSPDGQKLIFTVNIKTKVP